MAGQISPYWAVQFLGSSSYNGRFGYRVDGINDFNFDGIDDILIGCPNGSAAYVYYGSSDGIMNSPSIELPNDIVWGFGWDVCGVGDIKGNGQNFVMVSVEFGPGPNVYLYAFKSYPEIDIQPGNDFNHINPKSNGVIQVAILTTQDFDVNDVDTSTLLFGRTGYEASPKRISFKDVDKDGDVDMLLKFKTIDTGIQCGDTIAYLTGMTLNGQDFIGFDSIETVGSK